VPLISDPAKSTPWPEICRKDFSRTEAALSSYSVVIIVCDYIYVLPGFTSWQKARYATSGLKISVEAITPPNFKRSDMSL